MNQATKDFIRQHQEGDVRQLAFLGSKYPEVDMPFALDQIRGRKMACVKLPRWAGIDGIIYPPHISMEQCSSEFTAMYKAELAARLLHDKICEFSTESADALKFAKNDGTCDFQEKIAFVDMTGGFGVDFSYIAARLGMKAMYVERQTHLCETAEENFNKLGLENVVVRNGDGVEVLHSFSTQEQGETQDKSEKPLRLIFIDPARRDDAGNKVVSLQECTPDVTQLQDEMLEKSEFVIVKLSPMLDWHRAVKELNCVREVHIVSVGNECKELLLVLSTQPIDASIKDASSLKVYCVNDDQVVSYQEDDDSVVRIVADASDVSAMGYLYEPNASLMKASCFSIISSRYGVKMLAKNSHLFVSQEPVADFPGRCFHIKAVSNCNKKELKRQFAGISQANIATRNFPLSVADLRKRLKLKEGGDTYIFATTLSDESHTLLICEKWREVK